MFLLKGNYGDATTLGFEMKHNFNASPTWQGNKSSTLINGWNDIVLSYSNKTPVPSLAINNNYKPFYARRFMACYPQHEGFFRTRKQTSEDKDATNLPELTPEYV